MAKKIKKYFIPGAALIASVYFSSFLAIGGLIGYLGTKLFDKKFMKTGKVTPLKIDFGNWEIHLHHWISGVLAISAICLVGFPSTFPVFWIGALGGLAFHDIYTDKKWYRVIYKK